VSEITHRAQSFFNVNQSDEKRVKKENVGHIIEIRVRANQSLKLTEVAVDDLTRAKQPVTIGHDLARADWIPLLRHFVAAA
jgi:hypothetical protein